jgi:predicted GNAT family N-acyltransferase
MRYSLHDRSIEPKTRGFWKGTFTPRMDLSIERSAAGAYSLRRAAPGEVPGLLAAPGEALSLAATDSVLRMTAKNPDVVQAICAAGAPERPVGVFAYLPLNAFGAGAITCGAFDGASPDPAWICRAGEEPEAFYWWLIHAPGKLARTLGAIAALFRALSPGGAPIFTRAATDHAARLHRGCGFMKAREIYPDAPEWLVVALPEGAMPSRRAKTSPVGLTVEPVASMEGLAKVFALRAATYLAEQFCTFDEEFDGNDFCSSHFLATFEGDAAGAIRLRWFGDFAKLERLCVRREYRGQGVKEALVEAALEHARLKGFTRVYGHARADLVGMWAEFGFRPLEGRAPFRFAGLDYVEIVLELEPSAKRIRLGDPPMMLTRPEGRWDEPGPLDLSILTRDAGRDALMRQETRFRPMVGA